MSMRSNFKTLLLTGNAVVLSLLLSAPSFGDDVVDKFEMTVIQDVAFGEEIVSGDLDLAIASIGARSYGKREAFPVKNNLCVAFTMNTEFEKATLACDEAIAISKARMNIDKEFGYAVGARNYAMSLTNRGVLRLLLGETEAARNDFEKARSQRATLSSPRKNLAYLAERGALQQAKLLD